VEALSSSSSTTKINKVTLIRSPSNGCPLFFFKFSVFPLLICHLYLTDSLHPCALNGQLCVILQLFLLSPIFPWSPDSIVLIRIRLVLLDIYWHIKFHVTWDYHLPQKNYSNPRGLCFNLCDHHKPSNLYWEPRAFSFPLPAQKPRKGASPSYWLWRFKKRNSPPLLFFFSFFQYLDWIQDLSLTRQGLYYLSHVPIFIHSTSTGAA
jgi:hypothetical protein